MYRLGVVLLAVVTLSVHAEFDEIPQLKITEHPTGGTIPKGDRFDFVCKAETSADKTVTYTWKRLKNLNSLNPEFESLGTDDTGSEGVYIEYNAQESAFYFCVVTSHAFQTTSNGAYLEVAYLEEFADDGGPSDRVYENSALFIELQCQVPDSNPYPTVQWYKHEVPYAAENAILKRDSSGRASNLVVFDLTVDDSGKYHCEVENEGAGVTYQSTFANIEIKPAAVTVGIWDAQSVVEDYEVQGSEGTTITLYAGVVSKPKADYTWTLNAVEILDDDRHTKADYGRSLIIRELTQADQGTYMQTYSISGQVKGSTALILKVSEVVLISEGDVFDYATVKGEDLVLDCGCIGSPPDWIQYNTDTPGTQWFKNGQLLVTTANTVVSVTVNGKNTGEATISSTSDSESGTYSCTCFNQEQFLTFTKNVYIADERQALTITADKEGWGLVGSTISISCAAEGIPRPVIEWYKGGNKVVEGVFPRSEGFSIVYEKSMFTTIGYLVVEGGLYDDSGVFECKASHNVKGAEYNLTTTSNLVVAKPTSSRIQCLNTTVQEGKTATIVCGVSGVPLPTVVYTKINETDESLIELDETFGAVTNISYFTIFDVKMSDAGTYRGDASNVASGGLLGRFDTMTLTVTEISSRMSMNAIIGLSVLVAFILLGGLVLIILFGRWRREKAFTDEMSRLIREREEEVAELQQKLQLRSMEHVAPTLGNPLHQLPETRRQLPSFYAANIAVLAATPSAKFLPPSLADLKKRKLTGSVIHERTTISPSSVHTIMSDIENPEVENDADDVELLQ